MSYYSSPSPISNAPLVGPVIALASWTFVMEIWLYAYRVRDVHTYKLRVTPNTTHADLHAAIPRHRHFPADNFAHLHEQPTVFYAVSLGLALLQVRDAGTLAAAWAYVGARVVHSLIQATVNVPMRRFQAFATSGLLLAGLTGRAAVVALWG